MAAAVLCVNEAALVERAQIGDKAAFEELLKLHRPKIYSLCLRMSGNTATAEDLCQEAFLQLFRKISTFRAEAAFATWLHRIAVNIVLQHLRSKGHRNGHATESLDELGEEDGEYLPWQFGNRDLVLESVPDRMMIEAAMTNLSPGYRAVFVLHDIQGYSHREIAGMLGCTIGNSKSQLSKARRKLSRMVSPGIRRKVRR